MILENKVAVITGASKGFGMETAYGYAREGADLALCARGIDKLNAVADKIRAETGRKVLAVKTDITVKAEVVAFFEQIEKTFGRIDIMVNNAAMYPPSPLVDMPEEMMDAVFNLNLKGTFLCTQQAARIMLKQKYGKIINIGSGGGRRGFGFGLSHYQATKGALIAATRDWAVELGPSGITVNCVAFGTFPDKETLAAFGNEFFETYRQMTMLKKYGEVKDVVPILVFLASSGSDYMTAETISYDSGITWS